MRRPAASLVLILAVLAGTATVTSSASASVVTGIYYQDGRFGDTARIEVAGTSGGDRPRIRYLDEGRWRISDESGIRGKGRCSQGNSSTSVICVEPVWADLRIRTGSGHDRVAIRDVDAEGPVLRLGEGDDSAYWDADAGYDGASISGGAGDDSIALVEPLNGRSGQGFAASGPGDDEIFGSSETDLLFGRQGDDVIRAGRGRDLVLGGSGADRLHGGSGGDDIDSGNDYAMDLFLCGGGNDFARFAERDVLPGHDCERRYRGGAGSLDP